MRRRNLAGLAAAAAGAWSLPAPAQLAVDRLWIDFARPADTRADILVRNEGKQRAYVTVVPQEVIDAGADGERRVQIVDPEQLGLLVTPNRLVMEPGDLRTIRVVSLNKPLQNDRIYRIRIAPQVGALEASTADAQARGVAVKVLSAYDVLVTVRPPQAKPEIVATRAGNVLSLANTGNSNVLLFDGERCAATVGNGAPVCVRIGARRIYPGNVWRIPLDHADDKVRFSQRRSAAIDPLSISF